MEEIQFDIKSFCIKGTKKDEQIKYYFTKIK